MAVKKRITRKQLLKEPDTFMTFTGKAVAFLTAHQKQIGYLAVGCLVAVIAVAGFWYFSGLSEDKAYALLNEGLTHYGQAGPDQPEGHFNKVARERLHQLVSEYGSTTAGKLGWKLYGDVSYEAGEYDAAVKAYETALNFLADYDSLSPLIWNSLAYAYEGKQDLNGAIQCWEKVTGFSGTVAKPDAYFNLGRMYEQRMDDEKAEAAYRKVVEEFPDSVHADVARGKLVRFEG